MDLAFRTHNGAKFHLISWQSQKQRRVASSRLVAEAIAANAGFAAAIHLQQVLPPFWFARAPIHLVMDSKGLHHFLATQKTPWDLSATTAINQIRIDYEAGIIDSIVWVPGIENPSDDLTKPMSGLTTYPLDTMMRDGVLPVDISNLCSYGKALQEKR